MTRIEFPFVRPKEGSPMHCIWNGLLATAVFAASLWLLWAVIDRGMDLLAGGIG